MFFISNPGSGKLALLKILNLLENSSYELTDIEFSLPEINTDPSPIRNTKVIAHFLGTKGFYGKKQIVYNRIHSGDLPVLTVLRGLATTYYELIPVLNSTYNLRLTPEDIVDGALPDIVSEEIIVTIPFNPNSYLYYSTPAVVTEGDPPSYSVDRPSDTFVGYACVGFDRYSEFSTVLGDTYRNLYELNSYECGYEDTVTRVALISPSDMDFFTGDDSKVFTIELKNPIDPVTATLVLPANITASKTVFPLTVAEPTDTFTVTSAQAGNYLLTITNDDDLDNPEPVSVTVLELQETQITVTPPLSLDVFPGQPSEVFTIQVVNVNEPITITVSVSAGATVSNSEFVFDSVTSEATFTVQGEIEDSYTLSFTNNQGFVNPSNIIFNITSAALLSFVSPASPYNPNVQTGLFNVTLTNGSEPVIVTPVTDADGVVDPVSIELTPAVPVVGFRVTYTTVGAKTVSLTNNSSIVNPEAKLLTVVEPYVTITAPITTIVAGNISDAFTLTLNDSAASKTIEIGTDAGTVYNSDDLEDYSFTLTPAEPSATFKLEYSSYFNGAAYAQALSFGQLPADPIVNFNVENLQDIAISIPASINTEEPYLMVLTRTVSVGTTVYEFDANASIDYLDADTNNQITFADGEVTKNVYFVNTGSTSPIYYGAGTIVGLNKVVAGQNRTAVALARDSLFHKTELLFRPNANNDYTDKSSNNLSVTTSSVSTVNTAGVRKWSASDYVVTFGTDPFVDYGYIPEINIANKDFCIEGIHKLTVSTATFRNLIDFRGNDAAGEGLTLFVGPSTRQVFAWDTAYAAEFGVNILETPVNSLPVMNTYFHWAFSVEAGVARIFIDGQLHGQTAFSPLPTSLTGIRIGSNKSLDRDFTGYCDSIRLTVGEARYTSSFSPITRRFEQIGVPNISLSKLLVNTIETNIESEVITVTAGLINAEIKVYPIPVAGITFSQTELTLTPASPSATFTFTAQVTGNYSIGVTTNVDPYIALPEVQNIVITQPVVIPDYTIAYLGDGTATPRKPSGDYQITLSNLSNTISGDIILPVGLSANKQYFNLDAGAPTDTFHLVGNAAGSYEISFINNEAFINPPAINHEIAIQPSIYISGYYSRFTTFSQDPYDLGTNNSVGWFSVYDTYDSFGEALVLPYPITITPQLTSGFVMYDDLGNVINDIVLTDSADSHEFRFVFTTEGSKQVTFNNDKGLPWHVDILNLNTNSLIQSAPLVLDYHAGALGNVVLVEPVVALEFNQESSNFTVTITGIEEPTTITVATSIPATVTIDAGHLVSGNQLLLANSSDSATFTVTPLEQGYLVISLTNNKFLNNPSNSIHSVYSGTVPSLSITPPAHDLVYSGEFTNNFVLVLNNPVSNVVVGYEVIQDLDLAFEGDTITYTLTPADPQVNFKFRYSNPGTNITFDVTNESGLNTPSLTFDSVSDQTTIDFTSPPSLAIEQDQYSDYITVTATNLTRDYTCTPYVSGTSTGLTFDISNFTLTTAQPSAQFRVIGTVSGNRTIGVSAVPANYPNSGNEIFTNSTLVFVISPPAAQAIYTVTAPATAGSNSGFNSENYTVELLDLTKSFNVTVVPDDVEMLTATPSVLALNSSTPIKTFTLNSDSEFAHGVSFTNSGGFDNPDPIVHTVVKPIALYFEGTYNSDTGFAGQPYNTTTNNTTQQLTIYDFYEYFSVGVVYPYPVTITATLPPGCTMIDVATMEPVTEFVLTASDFWLDINFVFTTPGVKNITLSIDKSVKWLSGLTNFGVGKTLTSDLQLTYNVTATEPTGGTVTTVDDGGTIYNVHTFTEPGEFYLNEDKTVEVLVVAGGGAGGSYNSGGGGGAGGVIQTSLLATSGTHTVTVGAGGAGTTNTAHTNGGNSSLFDLTAIGGGRGGYGGFNTSSINANSGGSGGGGQGTWSSTNRAGATGTAGQGFAGGTGRNDANTLARCAGGGGGAGGAGGNATFVNTSNGNGGNGGIGITSSINGTPTYYGGGGGGATNTTATNRNGAGGLGGGGAGGTEAPGTDATPNTGGGGGGSSSGYSHFKGGNGGSGIVIIRYVQ